MADLAYFYLDFMATLGLAKVNLVGTSLGGWLGSEIAVRDQASLADADPGGAGRYSCEGLAQGPIFFCGRARRPSAIWWRILFSPKKMLSQPQTEEQIDLMLKNSFTVARLAWQPRLYDPHLYKWLHRITLPTLILWGDSDKLLPRPMDPNSRS